MSRSRDFKYLVGDFETTVYEGQSYTEVWASAVVEMFTDDVKIFHSIDETFDYFKSFNTNLVVYYHNLKFDGTFWVDWLLTRAGYKLATDQVGSGEYDVSWTRDKFMKSKTFKLSISDMGMWYTVKIKTGNKLIELRDSLKLLPFSVKEIGKSFGTKHKKLDMVYEGFRFAGCEITEDEQRYIANDVLVVKEALEIMYKQGHKKLTIGACCLEEYKAIIGAKAYETSYPDLYNMSLDESYGKPNAGEYIRKSYKGGWCYLVKGKENKLYKGGVTCDVNSLYPSMMHSMSGNVYPIGEPTFWQGNRIPDEARGSDKYFFVRLRTRFYLKEGKLPFIQIKGSLFYKGTECLETSDVYYKGKYHKWLWEGETKKPTSVILTLTCTDYKLFLEHYRTEDFEILDGCYFHAMSGIFDEYIDKYRKIKMESKGALRTLAKLFLNNLYGKMASNTDSSFKVPYIDEDNIVKYITVPEFEKKPGYIAVGSAITSYARNFTIRAAQANFYGKDKAGFIYADTDSIHCDLPQNRIKGIKVHSTEFCCWKVESHWDKGWFVRQKTYAEHITHDDGEPVESPYWNIKCAGMPERCKQLLAESMRGYQYKEGDEKNYTEDQLYFLTKDRTIEDFTIGLKVPGKLYPKRISGGIVLTEGFYEMR